MNTQNRRKNSVMKFLKATFLEKQLQKGTLVIGLHHFLQPISQFFPFPCEKNKPTWIDAFQHKLLYIRILHHIFIFSPIYLTKNWFFLKKKPKLQSKKDAFMKHCHFICILTQIFWILTKNFSKIELCNLPNFPKFFIGKLTLKMEASRGWFSLRFINTVVFQKNRAQERSLTLIN